MPKDLFLMFSNKQRGTKLVPLLQDKSDSFKDNVHFFTLSHKGPFYALQPNFTHTLVHLQQSLFQDCHLLLCASGK